MTLAVRELQEQFTQDSASIERFLAENTFPLTEGTTTTFFYRGEADRVSLKHWIYGLPSSQPFRRIDGTDVWYLAFELPSQSRVEYKLKVVKDHQARLIRDPLNDATARDPFGANSVCYGPGYTFPEWSQEDPETRPGTLEVHPFKSDVFGDPRPIHIYLPPQYRHTRKYPLLVVHDGEDYLRFAELKTVLDNLIERLEVAPLIVAMTQSPRRLREYAADEEHARFLTEELVPALEERYPLVSEPRARGLMGASFGAVASFSTACRYPEFYGRLLLQSGSFAFTDIGSNQRGPAFEPIVEFINDFRDKPLLAAERMYVSCGMYESLIYENRSMVPLLQSTGAEIRYTEARDGHNWENWRDRLREGLSFLFPGPMWYVYE